MSEGDVGSGNDLQPNEDSLNTPEAIAFLFDIDFLKDEVKTD